MSDPRDATKGARDGGAEPVRRRPDSTADDETAALVTRAKTGDAPALNELFARYYQTMLEVARRKLGPRLRLKEDPDDLAQTTFREAVRDFSSYQYQGSDSLLRWLIQILQNKIRDRAEFYAAGKRDAARERTIESPPQDEDTTPGILELMSPDLSVTQHVQRGENYDLLRQALGDLPSDYRTAITLVFFDGLSLRDAGERLGGRSEDAVRMMLRRAETKLGELLKASLGRRRE